MKLDLRQVNLLSIVYNDNREVLGNTLPVLRYMQSVADFGRVTLFSAAPVPASQPGIEVIQIFPTDREGLSHYLNRLVRYFVRLPFFMNCQDDGFIVDPTMWSPEFLGYDYIGAPWADGVVGNEGFCVQSQKFLWAKTQFHWNGRDGQDWFYCRTIRDKMEGVGVRFAPTEVAARFSSELTGHDAPTLGYHGRGYCPSKHAVGQTLIQRFR